MLKRGMILLMKLAVNALALLAVESLFDGIWAESPRATLGATVALALVNTFVRPLVVVLTLPLNILTLGLFTLLINAAMLKLVSWIIPTFHVEGFWTAVGGALVLSIVSGLLNWLLVPNRKELHVTIQRF
ncbi:MAG: phage holin family protein [Verrucomicrobiae bacterium]|nr:phage holin family protein [Verrucomicrobiae bacterium]